MKKQLQLLACALVLAGTANAVTVDQLVANGGWATETLTSCFKANSRQSHSHGVRFVKVSDTKVKIEGLYLGKYDFTFDLVNNSGSSTTDGTQLRIYYNNASPEGWKLEAGFTYSGWSGTAYNFTQYDYTYLTITDNGDGKYTLNATTPILFADPSTRDVPYYDIFDGLKLEIYKPNATASHTVQSYNYTKGSRYSNAVSSCRKSTSVNENYGMIVNLDRENRRFSMLNLGNKGYALNRSHNEVLFEGDFNPEEGTLTFDPMQYCWASDQWGTTSGSWGSSSSTNFKGFFYYYLTGFEFSSSPVFSQTLVGTYKAYPYPHHNNEEIAWVTNGGNKRTYEDGAQITIPPFTYYTTQDVDGCVDFRGLSYDNTVIEFDVDNDVTLQSDLNINKYDVNSELIYINATISTIKNGMHLDHYDLYVVPGVYTDINDENFIHHVELGHAYATLIDVDKYATEFTHPKQIIANIKNAKTVNLFIPTNELNVKSEENKYSFFLKAHYKEETNLDHTFHNLVTYTGAVTGIMDVEADEAAEVEYFTLQGVKIAEPVKGNIYIKRQGATVTKELYK